MALREKERKARGVVWTNEQHSRDDWPRAWKWIEAVLGGASDPRLVTPEMLIDPDLPGLRPLVASRISENEAHRVIRVWWALWQRMAGFGYCNKDMDPSFQFANRAPQPRQAVWGEGEAVRLSLRSPGVARSPWRPTLPSSARNWWGPSSGTALAASTARTRCPKTSGRPQHGVRRGGDSEALGLPALRRDGGAGEQGHRRERVREDGEQLSQSNFLHSTYAPTQRRRLREQKEVESRPPPARKSPTGSGGGS